MNRLKNFLLSTTAHTPPWGSLGMAPVSYAIPSNRRAAERVEELPKGPRPRYAGVVYTQLVKVPPLSDDDLQRLDSHASALITRHIAERHLDITLQGSFRFGTIAGYRRQDESLIGRFSDFQEGFQRDVFCSRVGLYNGEFGNLTLSDVPIEGFEDPLVHEFSVNDYCSCSSRGEFSRERAHRIRDRGNPDVGAYVVYDLKKLVDALKSIISEQDDNMRLRLFARHVEYGNKDRRWEIENHFNFQACKDYIAIYLGTVFIKSPDYEHEEELRIILTDPNKVGQLSDGAASFILNDPRIADAIVDHGTF